MFSISADRTSSLLLCAIETCGIATLHIFLSLAILGNAFSCNNILLLSVYVCVPCAIDTLETLALHIFLSLLFSIILSLVWELGQFLSSSPSICTQYSSRLLAIFICFWGVLSFPSKSFSFCSNPVTFFLFQVVMNNFLLLNVLHRTYWFTACTFHVIFQHFGKNCTLVLEGCFLQNIF